MVGLVVMVVAAFRNDPAMAARTYWTGAVITTAAATLMGIPRGWSGALDGFLLSVCLILLCTYVRTPYLKVGNKTRTLFSAQAEPYGMNLSTPKTWWLLVFVAIVFMYPVLAFVDDGVETNESNRNACKLACAITCAVTLKSPISPGTNTCQATSS